MPEPLDGPEAHNKRRVRRGCRQGSREAVVPAAAGRRPSGPRRHPADPGPPASDRSTWLSQDQSGSTGAVPLGRFAQVGEPARFAPPSRPSQPGSRTRTQFQRRRWRRSAKDLVFEQEPAARRRRRTGQRIRSYARCVRAPERRVWSLTPRWPSRRAAGAAPDPRQDHQPWRRRCSAAP